MHHTTTSSISTVLHTLNRSFNRLNLLRRQISFSYPRMTQTYKVAKVDDLKDGQMKEVEIPGTEGKVLLSRVKGNYYATGSKCTRTKAF
jgi:hypothetical protein